MTAGSRHASHDHGGQVVDPEERQHVDPDHDHEQEHRDGDPDEGVDLEVERLDGVPADEVYDVLSTTEGKVALRDELLASLNGLLSTGQISNIYFKEFVVQ